MPLIIMCGYPCSGKTRRTEELKAHFEETTDRQVHIVGDRALGVDRNSVYADSQKEKDTRASLKAEVERKVNKDNIVILDSLNYIKGYRYELFCLTKHAQTPHCLVHCLTSGEESSLWNKNREAAEQYSQDIFDALVQRFEAPDSRNRWDSPLFTVLKDDILPLEAVSDALFKRKAPPPNQSTQSQPLSSTNFLYELDKITQDVLMAIFNAQKTSVPGDLISVPGATEKVELTRTVNMAELRKLRRQFISYSKMHPTEKTGQIANMFVQYLNKGLH
ncbi:protein KTI12 homolog isoform X1 [Xiphophorus maculatus]|uniref:Protein KTI12 homolog n=1 Tax=Xiphophorus maculatus TaxID=8083 RepID=A0A3B5QT68_XIPMA|nr:protein KTI12 homolog isoform X1 [Xiphophorus maculatus]XP_027860702.1 protein KTI12 homolog isoform X1 [Xiphophorus couchianus]